MGISILSPVPAVGLSDTVPSAIAAAGAAGASSLQSRADHVHPWVDSGWLTPSLVNSWVDYDTTYAPARYRKVNGVVFLRGLVKNGTAADIFTLPAGFRPQIRHLFACECNPNVIVRVDVANTGLVTISGSYSNGWVALNNVVFPADA